MKKGYWVVAYRSISDASAVKAYGALAVPAVRLASWTMAVVLRLVVLPPSSATLMLME